MNMRGKEKKVHVCTREGCNSKFSRPFRLAQHLLAHDNVKPFTCPKDDCFKSYSNKSHLNRHITTAHEKQQNVILFSCPECLKTYSNRQNLKKHIKIKHIINIPFTCDHCKAQFNKKHFLNAHMYIHTGVKSFSCEVCSKDFITLHEKKRHMRCHKTYNCEDCYKEFKQWSKYQKHRQLEHETKAYICNDCGKKYKRKTDISRHLKMHSRTEQYLRIFVCPYPNCHRRYQRNSNLTHHMIIKHEGIKYICDICDAGLSSQAKLKQHLKLHEQAESQELKPKSLATGRKARKDKDTFKQPIALKLAGISVKDVEKMDTT